MQSHSTTSMEQLKCKSHVLGQISIKKYSWESTAVVSSDTVDPGWICAEERCRCHNGCMHFAPDGRAAISSAVFVFRVVLCLLFFHVSVLLNGQASYLTHLWNPDISAVALSLVQQSSGIQHWVPQSSSWVSSYMTDRITPGVWPPYCSGGGSGRSNAGLRCPSPATGVRGQPSHWSAAQIPRSSLLACNGRADK